MLDQDTRERAALLRIRVLRRDGYRCQWRKAGAKSHAPACGSPASHVGSTPDREGVVALCLRHSLPDRGPKG